MTLITSYVSARDIKYKNVIKCLFATMNLIALAMSNKDLTMWSVLSGIILPEDLFLYFCDVFHVQSV
ncbi:hypothetical protein CAJAP_09530 [Camponotus japonicus]